jgi:hypothetical protein
LLFGVSEVVNKSQCRAEDRSQITGSTRCHGGGLLWRR